MRMRMRGKGEKVKGLCDLHFSESYLSFVVGTRFLLFIYLARDNVHSENDRFTRCELCTLVIDVLFLDYKILLVFLHFCNLQHFAI